MVPKTSCKEPIFHVELFVYPRSLGCQQIMGTPKLQLSYGSGCWLRGIIVSKNSKIFWRNMGGFHKWRIPKLAWWKKNHGTCHGKSLPSMDEMGYPMTYLGNPNGCWNLTPWWIPMVPSIEILRWFFLQDQVEYWYVVLSHFPSNVLHTSVEEFPILVQSEKNVKKNVVVKSDSWGSFHSFLRYIHPHRSRIAARNSQITREIIS